MHYAQGFYWDDRYCSANTPTVCDDLDLRTTRCTLGRLGRKIKLSPVMIREYEYDSAKQSTKFGQEVFETVAP